MKNWKKFIVWILVGWAYDTLRIESDIVCLFTRLVFTNKFTQRKGDIQLASPCCFSSYFFPSRCLASLSVCLASRARSHFVVLCARLLTDHFGRFVACKNQLFIFIEHFFHELWSRNAKFQHLSVEKEQCTTRLKPRLSYVYYVLCFLF